MGGLVAALLVQLISTSSSRSPWLLALKIVVEMVLVSVLMVLVLHSSSDSLEGHGHLVLVLVHHIVSSSPLHLLLC